MNTGIKRKVCFLLAICMILGTLTTGVLAASPENSGLPFTDVSPNAWYHSAVRYVYQHNIMQGMSPTTFEPNRHVSRAMVVATLFRDYHGRPADAGDSRENPFGDVLANAWHAPYVSWAYANDIAAGVGGGRFAPHDIVTREQFATMLHRYADPDYWVNVQMTFPDMGEWSDWAEDALHWAVSRGIIRGTNEGMLNARGNMSRAECAVMLMRFLTVDISHLLGQRFDDVSHLFGNVQFTGQCCHMDFLWFDTGLSVGVDPEICGGRITFVEINYWYSNERLQFRFWDVNGLSTADDVRAAFGRQPDMLCPTWAWEEDFTGRIYGYVYFLNGNGVRFGLGFDGTVSAITFQ